MKTIKKVWLFFVITMMIFSSGVKAQVSIGSSDGPDSYSLLDLNTTTVKKGLHLPRLNTQERDALIPPTSADSLAAKGLMIHNLQTGCINYWNGEQWEELCNGIAQSEIGSFDCERITIQGTYVAGRPLKSTENTMTVSVIVTRKGSYRITAEAILGNNSEANGYVFTATGEFATAGPMTVVLTGQGTPNKAFKETGQKDIFQITVNDKPYNCLTAANGGPTNEVLDIPPSYTFACSSIEVNNGNYVSGRVVSGGNITVRVISDVVGGEYSLYTDTINGMWFESRGTLLKGSQHIVMRANGKPLTGGTFDYVIHSNSTQPTPVCLARVEVSYPPFRIQVYGNNGGDWGLFGDDRAVMPAMVKNADLFGLSGSPSVNYDAPIVVESMTIAGESTSSAVSVPANTNMVFVSYSSVPNTTMIDALYDFVTTRDGFLIYSVENADALGNIAIKFNSPVTLFSEDAGPNNMLLQDGSNLVNGLFMNLGGKYIGRDGGGNLSFTNYETNWNCIAASTVGARMIIHKRYPIVLCGDGGIFSGGKPGFYQSSDYHPARVDDNGNPIPTRANEFVGGVVYNSALLANLIMWAIEETNRK